MFGKRKDEKPRYAVTLDVGQEPLCAWPTVSIVVRARGPWLLPSTAGARAYADCVEEAELLVARISEFINAPELDWTASHEVGVSEQ